jgi:inositol oxygenase
MKVSFDFIRLFGRQVKIFFPGIISVNVLKGKTWNDQSEFDAAKNKAQFRQYEDACDRVKGFYREQHGMSCDTILVLEVRRPSDLPHDNLEKQTMDFNINVRVKFNSQKRARMGIWQAMEMLNELVDESDPDVSVHSAPFTVREINDMLVLQTSVSQIEHLLQTAEAIRRDGKPDWMQVSFSLSRTCRRVAHPVVRSPV